jgi:hypothetical protein
MRQRTLIIGTIKFKESVRPKERKELIHKIKVELELNPLRKYEAYSESYEDELEFQHVNWHSHLDREKIMSLFKEIRDKVSYFSVELYYLDPNFGEIIHYDEEEKVMRITSGGLEQKDKLIAENFGK